ncbi:Microspherule protein 1 [Tritrichomonas musculus]|mgnify:CR=1 FL=1|uniref:Microspherule protein 1 n=1 Tax=Tritrichomonas musculus TaxID=1915356 RepID=A0ABR2K9K8_9EUKA
MTEAVSPDPRTIKWTPADDAYVVYLLLCCPFTEFQRNIPMLSNKCPKAIVSRFQEIISNPALIQKVNNECKSDIISYKSAPWTKHENLSLIRLVHNNKKCNHLQFLIKYPMLFHPSRTASSLNASFVRLKSKDHISLSDQLSQFNAAVEKIHEECKNLELLPFPGESELKEDPKTAIEKLLYPPKLEKEESTTQEYNIESFRQTANEKMSKKSFAALVTSGAVKLVEKCRTIFGRASPKCTPDVDLAEFNLQSISRNHCAIFLAKDLNFYIECLGSMIMVNTYIFQKGNIVQIHDTDLLDIGGVPFVFFENKELMENLRNVANK